MIRIVTIGLAAIVAMVTAAVAQQTVTVTGVGFVQGQDLATARDQAIRDAHIRAVERAMGVTVDSRLALHRSLLIDDTVLTRTEGVVRSYEILYEGSDALGLYQVQLRAEVDSGRVKTLLAHLAGQKSVLMLGPSGDTADSAAARRLLGQIGRRFQEAGFQIDHAQASAATMDRFDSAAAMAAAKDRGADLVVVGTIAVAATQCPTANFCWALGRGAAVLYGDADGRILAAAEKADIRGFAGTVDQAREDVQARTVDAVVRSLMGAIVEEPRIVAQVAILHLPDYGRYQALKRSLAGLRWVEAVEEDLVGYHPIKSVLIVHFNQEPTLLTGMLARIAGYTLTARSGLRFTLEPTGAPE